MPLGQVERGSHHVLWRHTSRPDHLERRNGVEVGWLSLQNTFVGAGVAGRCVQVTVRPHDADRDAAGAYVAANEGVTGTGITRRTALRRASRPRVGA